uniref:CARP motif domain-containing protein n=1 Tax=Nomascus leucogenys TaxID=61853 RepID=A0A2I3GIQ1_NOMLE
MADMQYPIPLTCTVEMETAPNVQAFDSLLAGPVAEDLKISKEAGGDVQKHAEMVHTGLKLERALLVTASQCQQPAANKLSKLLAPTSEQIKEVTTFREENRGSKLFNHLSAVSKILQALDWVAMAPKPGPYVKEMNDAAMFYTNRVLKEYKDVDKKHVDWVKLQACIKEFHTTGLPGAKRGCGKRTEWTCRQDPLPPPPPVSTSSGSDESASCSALFAQINQGEGITHALNHISDDMKTQKNPTLKVMGKVPTISINKTDGCHAYLSKNSLDCEIVSARSSEMNVLIPTEAGDFSEFPLPKQFKTLWNGQKFVTTKHSYLPSLKYTSG